jgi:quinol monooxygenase YgiN
MLVLTAFIEVLPIDRGPIRAALTAVVAAAGAEEGCEEYGSYYEDTEQPGRFVFVER